MVVCPLKAAFIEAPLKNTGGGLQSIQTLNWDTALDKTQHNKNDEDSL